MSITKYRTLKDVPREEFLAPGTSLCAGCGALLVMRLFHKALGGDVVWVNAAGCITLMATFPYTPLKSSWFYTAMASAPAGAQGIRDALDILIRKGKLDPSENLKVAVVTGDGAASDIGLQSTSGAIHRGLDFFYLCVDNEAYGNTGFQASSLSPMGSETATTKPTHLFPAGNPLPKKDLFEIWRSHRPPYVATISPSHAVDLLRKVEKALTLKGPRLFLALCPCPTGWGIEPSESVKLARLAVETGIWPLKEAIYGEVSHTHVPSKRKPVEEYLKAQRRFAHLFRPVKNEEVIAEIQKQVDDYWSKVER
ncbi:MAG: pyruvate synthase [Candidatus Terraquivivens tikiterensis]|uniref:Pyruvate synthase n=1 Tax=Candidatus Terraquivivens tikiterensis TaxID=1980982 RepID=A0A2R7Y0P3_9ARCH|nr:MAG: pyruvate synthase [Candidatus Terraquivivens tikiterensis]